MPAAAEPKVELASESDSRPLPTSNDLPYLRRLRLHTSSLKPASGQISVEMMAHEVYSRSSHDSLVIHRAIHHHRHGRLLQLHLSSVTEGSSWESWLPA